MNCSRPSTLELHLIARRYSGRERISSTLQCTAVVHEAWLKLAQSQQVSLKDRAHFFAFGTADAHHPDRLCACPQEQEAGRGEANFSLMDSDALVYQSDVEILDLNAALEELEKLDPVQGQIVEMRYFSGLSITETAEALGVSESTVKREWLVAKTWIRRRLVESGKQP